MTFYEEEIQKNIDNLEKEGRLSLTKGFIQHGECFCVRTLFGSVCM